MKFIVIIILFLTQFSSLLGKCNYSTLYFPPNDTIHLNSLILMNGIYDELSNKYDINVLKNLNNGFPIYLVSDSHRVDLKILETNIGDINIIQILLEPKDNLIQGNTYNIVIENLNEDVSYINMRYNVSNWRFELAKWYVVESTDTIVPKILAKPKFIKKTSKIYGGGPEVTMKFQLKTNKSNIFLVETELKYKNEIKNFILWTEEDNIVSVGRNMCSGGFELKYNAGYKVRFRLIDEAGRKSKEWSEWVSFTSPKNPYK